MKKKQVILVANIPDLLGNQRNSAVYNYLTYLSTLSGNTEVDIHVFPHKTKSKTEKNNKRSPIVVALALLFKPFPKLKKTLSDFLLLRQQDNFVKRLFEAYPNPDGILEFYFYGSQLYKEVKKRNLPYTVFYDCPVYDQSIEVTSLHSYYKTEINRRQLEALRLANQIIGYSDPVKEFILNTYKVDSNKIRVFPTFIPDDGILSEFNFENRNYIGFIGSFLSWHKVELLISAFEDIVSELPNEAKLVLIGKGEEWERIEEILSRSPAKERIVLTGYVSLSELRQWRKKIRIGVMPGSNWYGSPLKLFEYLFAGIPFIAPETPTVTYIFRDKVECLITKNDNPIESLSENLLELYRNIDLRKDLTTNALSRMNTTFSEDKLVQILNKIVEY
ncbi:MAG: hypothetical protein CL842_02955 [Crocinitomicaceae bacterium]|nr:hypothetical protein [Crocinitomicaceae bacterium]|tara:strand:- start:145867 stop:147036 length:1170 start_codon:yes stop_codon:yes gene_type:complete